MVLPTRLISALRPGGSPSMHPPRPRTSRRAAESVSRPFPQSPSASTATIPRQDCLGISGACLGNAGSYARAGPREPARAAGLHR